MDATSVRGRRILFAYRFFGLGGVETAILTKASALRAAGADVQALFGEAYGKGSETIAAQPGVVTGLSRAEVLALLRQPFDLIVIVDYPQFVPIVELAKVSATVVFETHASLPLTIPDFFPRLRSSRIEAIVVPSVFNRRLIEAGGITDRPFAIVPNPVDTDLFRRLPLSTVPMAGLAAGQGPVVLWVGRLEDEKNPSEALGIASVLFRRGPGWRLAMVGDTWNYEAYHRQLDAQVAQADRHRVVFVRGVPNDQMPALYAHVAASGGCLLSTSLHESQPMIFLEAMACECPVVATRVDGVPDLITDGVHGRLYEVGDIATAATFIEELARPTAARRQEIVRNGLALIRDRHQLSQIAPRYAALMRLVRPEPSRRTPPLVSGVLAFLDGENFLREAIESVLAQTYPHWELLLVDDGSTDGSTAIARDYARRHPDRIRYCAHDGHGHRGKSASRNLGLRQARGELLAFLDHDDIWLPNKLEDQVALLDAYPEAAMVYGRVKYWHSWTGRGEDIERDGYTQLGVEPDTLVPAPQLLTLLLRDPRTVASSCSVLIRREHAMRVGGFEDEFLDMYDDVVFLAKLYAAFPVYVADDCWAHYRQHSRNSTVLAFRSGQWHPTRPNPERERLLTWIDEYLRATHVSDPDLMAVLSSELRPYREPDRRSPDERVYDACLDATLAILRGDSCDRALATIAAVGATTLDAQTLAERMFEAVPESTWNTPSAWRTFWPDARPDATRFLEALEGQMGIPGLSRQTLHVLEYLVQGTWLLRAVEGNEVALRFQPDSRSVRVAISKASDGPGWSIQLNSPWRQVRKGERLRIAFRIRADGPRPVGVGFAQAHAPWNNLGWYHGVDLSSGWIDVEGEFTAGDDDDNARVHFDLGGSSVPVEIGDLTLTRI